MKSLLFIFFPFFAYSQSGFVSISMDTGHAYIRADQSYVHLPDRAVVRARLTKGSCNIRGLSWTNKRYEFYVGYVDNELCFIQENRRTKRLVCCWLIENYKITYCE